MNAPVISRLMLTLSVIASFITLVQTLLVFLKKRQIKKWEQQRFLQIMSECNTEANYGAGIYTEEILSTGTT